MTVQIPHFRIQMNTRRIILKLCSCVIGFRKNITKLPRQGLKEKSDFNNMSRCFIFHAVPRMHIIHTLFYKQPASVLPSSSEREISSQIAT